MLPNPTPLTALLLSIAIIIAVVELSSPHAAIFALAAVILSFALNIKLRAKILPLFKILAPFTFLMLAVSWGRVLGGSDIASIVDEYVARFAFVVAVLVSSMLLATCIRPWDALAIADTCRLPRRITYIFVSLYPLSSHVRELGKRQLALLDLKGIDRNSFYGRILAYRRLVSPLFSSILSQQIINARSLASRGFFEKPPKQKIPKFVMQDLIWAIIFLVFFLFFAVIVS